jgi:hypothetical protein
MKIDIGKPTRPSSGSGFVLIAALLLVFPGSASVLCVAPGGHVAIEDINALCCIPSNVSIPDGGHKDSGFGSPDRCGGCTDIFLTPNGRTQTSNSYGSAAAIAHADDCLGNLFSAATCLYQCLPDLIPGYADTSPPVTALIPMRN